MTVEANLGEAEMSMGDILDLVSGDIIRLNSAADDIVTLQIDGKERFKGQIGLRRFRKSIQITETIDTEKDAVKRALEDFETKRKEKISGVKEIINDDDIHHNHDDELDEEQMYE